MASGLSILVLHAFCILGALADSLLLAIKPSQDSQGLVRFSANGFAGDDTSFAMDTTSNQVSASTCRNGNTNITFVSRQQADFFPGPSFELTIKCSRKSSNLLGLGPEGSSLPRQLFKSQQGIRQTMTFCLSSSRGELSFGRKSHMLFVSGDVLQGRSSTLVDIPLIVGGPHSYQIELTGVGIGSVHQRLTQATMVSVGITSRYTSLPSAAYSVLRSGVEKAASTKNVKRVATKFGELDLCFRMNATIFPNVTMEFGSAKATWTVSPLNYLVPKPGTKDVVCFAVKPASEKSPAAIGTFQQEDNWVEFNLQNKTLGVSGNLVARFNIGCESTSGS